MNIVQQLDKFHKTRAGYAVVGLVELGLAYGAVSWAIDSGNLLLYLATIILLYGGARNLVKAIIVTIKLMGTKGKS